MILLSENIIIKKLGNTIWLRARDYYRHRHITETWMDGVWLTAMVKGSGGEHYKSAFNTETGDYRCSCPYDYAGPCKHVGALMISFYHEGIPSLPSLPKQQAAEELIVPLSFKNSSGIFSEKTQTPSKNAQGQRYRLVFTVDFEQGWNSKSFIFEPKLQYVKKDGSFGRIESYVPCKLTEPTVPAERDLLAFAGSLPPYRIPLLSVIHLLAANKELTVFDLSVPSCPHASFDTFENLTVKFRCTGKNYGGTFVFEPRFMLSAPDGTDAEPLSLVLNVSGILCHLEGGTFRYNAANFMMNRLLSKIKGRHSSFYDGDIRDLAALVDANPGCGITVDFPQTKVQITSGGGKPVLEIEPAHRGIAIEIFFDYRGREIPSSLQELVLNLDHLNRQGDIFHLAERDLDSERAFKNYIIRSLADAIEPDLEDDDGTFHADLTLEEFLSGWGRAFIDAGVTLRMKKSRRVIHSSSGKVAFRLRNGIDWFEAETVYRDENGNESSLEIDFELMKHGVIKSGGGFIILGKEDIAKLQSLRKNGISAKGALRIHKLDFAAIETVMQDAQDKAPAEIALVRETYTKLKSIKGIGQTPLPEKFGGTLRKYQIEGYNWLHFLRTYNLNGCLADDMGLGKTVQTLALLQKLKENNLLRPALLVVPVSTIPNWEKEIARFAPGMTFQRHIGQTRNIDEDEIRAHDVTITSYHTLRNDIVVFSKIDFTYVVLDEAQNIKNAATKAFKAVKTIKADHRLALSGTPVENNTGELWSLFDFLNPGLLGTKEHFSAFFAKPIEQYADADAAASLRALVFPFILRRKKEMVAKELPPKEEIIVYCEMGARQKKVYDVFKKECRKKVEEIIAGKGKERGAIEIFEALLRLRQIALFPSLASPQFENVESCKFDLFTDMLDEITTEGHKVLVFSQFVRSLEFLKTHLEERKLGYAYIDGSTKKREAEISRFQENVGVKVFLLSLKAGGVGINLTAADYVILFDPWWNPAVEAQAVDRAHRIGQTRKVTAYRLIVKDTVEEKILKLQEKKRALVNDLIAEEASFFKSLSGADIVDLFE